MNIASHRIALLASLRSLACVARIALLASLRSLACAIKPIKTNTFYWILFYSIDYVMLCYVIYVC